MEGSAKEEQTYLIVSNPQLMSDNTVFEQGSLWAKPSYFVRGDICDLRSVDNGKLATTSRLTLFQIISVDTKDLLLAIKIPSDRMNVYQNKEWLDEASEMIKGTQVTIQSVKGIPDQVLGTVRYRGILPGAQGTKFGVEIIDPTARGKGTTDGVWKKEKYFECEDNCGLFVNISKLRLHKTEQFNFSLTEDMGMSVEQEFKSHMVKLGDRVVWMSDNGPESGTVLWMGLLSDDPTREAMVGVEFDNPVGSGTGKYKGKQLFKAKKGHASLVPVIGLLKEEELFGGNAVLPRTTPDVVPRREHVENMSSGFEPLHEFPSLNSRVEIRAGPPRYGVIRWIGPKPGSEDKTPDKLMAGLEMEKTDNKCYTDGTFLGRHLFTCPPHKAFFIHLHKCHPDQRLASPVQGEVGTNTTLTGFGNGTRPRREPVEYSDSESAPVAPLCPPRICWSEDMCGKHKGIQGGHNSCYMDSVLFAMFSCTSNFDFIFSMPNAINNSPWPDTVKKSLQECVVNPLRCNFYVSSEEVKNFRRVLDSYKPQAGFMTNMKDPEEFLNYLLGDVLHATEFVKLSNGQNSHLYQLLGHREVYKFPSVQQLLEYSIVDTNVRFQNCPQLLMLQMPRYGVERVHDFIFPNPTIDISDITESLQRQCTLCSNSATIDCTTCFLENPPKKLADCTFCLECFNDEHCQQGTAHSHRMLQQRHTQAKPKREKLSLLAVVCIETSHYVALVKCGTVADSNWIFFDSMAEMGDGGIAPEVRLCDNISSWFDMYQDGQPPKEHSNSMIKYLCQDAYLCIYGKM